jgi:hypothetical protein
MSSPGNLEGYDASKFEPNNDFDPLPAGDYNVVIVNSERKKTKSGTGEMLKLELQVLDGKFQNRKLWDQLNIRNPSDVAQKIALGTLSSICRAVNVLTPRDSSELHGKPLTVRVRMLDRSDYGPQNEIASYKAISSPVDHFRDEQSTRKEIPDQSTPW